MAEIKAEEDDEEGFGDFKFASSFPNQTTVHSAHTNGRNSITIADEDEWGDFIEHPLGSELSSGLSHTQSPPKPSDSFELFSNHPTKPSAPVATRIDPVSNRVESEETRWMKPKGALPLSIFGDVVDEEEQSDADESQVGESKEAFVDKSGSTDYSGVVINEFISRLYTQSQQIKDDNWFNSESNGSNSNLNGIKLNANMNDLNLDFNWSNSNSDLASNLDNHDQQIKAENGFSSESNGSNSKLNGTKFSNDFSWSNLNSDLASETKDLNIFTTLDNQDQLNKAENGLSSNSNGSKLKFDGTNSNSNGGLNLDMNGSTWGFSELSMNTDLVAGNKDFDIFTNLHNQRQHNNVESGGSSNSNGLSSNSNVSFSNVSGSNSKLHESTSNHSWVNSNSNSNGLNSNFDAFGANEEIESDDDTWDFKDAYSELKVGEGDAKVYGKGQENAEVTAYSSGFDYGSHGPNDLFAASNGFSSKSSDMDIGLNFKPLSATENCFSPDLNLKSEQNGNENGLYFDQIAGAVDFDENFGEFKYAFSETASKQEGNEVKSEESQKGALPLSIFGDEELETDESLNSQNIFTYQHATHSRNGLDGQSSNLSINDLISSLYSQEEQIPSVDSPQKPDEMFLDSTTTLYDSNSETADDEIIDDSWEFKDASSYTEAKDETSLFSPIDANENISTKLKLNNFVDFFSILKDELCYVARCHLESQKAQNTDALSGEDMKLEIDEEIQEACKELYQENVLSKPVHSEDHPPRVICLNDFCEVLLEPKFDLLESEYHLSTRLQLAMKDLRSANELFMHAKSTLNVLKLRSSEEQSSYVSTWSKIITVCAQELKHGAWIWKQSLEKNVQSQILSESGGKQFIVALGEVYRVLVIIGASAKLYKPWILSSCSDPTGIYALLEESYTLWRNSGLEDTLQSMFDPIGTEDDGTIKGLLASIKYVRDLDAPALGNLVFSQHESKCRLSLLTLEAVPDMKMVLWNGEHYLLKLANLWANLINSDPPNLLDIHVS